MSILDEILSQVKKLDSDEQLRIICDEITKEEIDIIDEYEGPSGANVFLSLPIIMPEKFDSSKYESYICLEREAAGAFIISHWNCIKNSTTQTPKRVKAWDVKHDKPKKILKEFAERLSFLKGE